MEDLYFKAKQDNDLIYHAVVPSPFRLPSLKLLEVAQPVAPTCDNLYHNKSCHIKESFAHLVPLVVRNATKMFLKKNSEMVNKLSAACERANSIIDS
ncbi:hypothetical protein MXB_4117 [Myxobolus squamalis]|nr:hypothetical protein MXB_4117 [Myxobolus squamalis]